jgi:hypothetical protein
MGLNANHTVEELGNIRCAIVEKNIPQARVDFLTPLLTGNGYKVVCVEAEAPKAKASVASTASSASTSSATAATDADAANGKTASTSSATDANGADAVTSVTPVTEPVEVGEVGEVLYTLGVTDLLFNPINAVFGRLLRTSDGHVVTNDYWNQKDAVSRDEVPYFEKK